MPVYLRKLASAAALWASCSSPWIFSAISLASNIASVSGVQCRLIGPDSLGKARDERVGGQLVADRRLCYAGQCRHQRRQVVQIEVVPDVDHEPQFAGAIRRRGAGAQ